MEISVELTDYISEAEAVLALQSKIRKNPQIKSLATSHGIPIYVTKVKEKQKKKSCSSSFQYPASLPKESLLLAD